MSELKPDDDLDQEKLSKALKEMYEIEEQEKDFKCQIDWSKIINYKDKHCNLAEWAANSRTCHKEIHDHAHLERFSHANNMTTVEDKTADKSGLLGENGTLEVPDLK